MLWTKRNRLFGQPTSSEAKACCPYGVRRPLRADPEDREPALASRCPGGWVLVPSTLPFARSQAAASGDAPPFLGAASPNRQRPHSHLSARVAQLPFLPGRSATWGGPLLQGRPRSHRRPVKSVRRNVSLDCFFHRPKPRVSGPCLPVLANKTRSNE